ncbi:hypothetical protein EJB05_12378, partial [Eragrostis curvula]
MVGRMDEGNAEEEDPCCLEQSVCPIARTPVTEPLAGGSTRGMRWRKLPASDTWFLVPRIRQTDAYVNTTFDAEGFYSDGTRTISVPICNETLICNFVWSVVTCEDVSCS